jgi:hypothetical protein
MISSKQEFFIGLWFIIGLSFFAGMVFTALLVRYGIIYLPRF